MTFSIIFAKRADKKLAKLPQDIQKRIVQKLIYYSKQENMLGLATTIKGASSPTHRYRIGSYRIIFEVKKNSLNVLDIDHRKNIYR